MATPPHEPIPRARWRPQIRLGALLSGLLVGLGGAVLLQQAGLRVLTTAFALQILLVGLASAVLLPSLLAGVGVWRANRALRDGASGIQEGAP